MIGGGSGGHIFPLITIADKYLEESKSNIYDIHFIISKNNQDYKYLKNTNYNYTEFPVAKLRRYFDLKNFIDIFIFIFNIFRSFIFLIKNRPKRILSKGGFVSLPFGISALLLNIPLYLHETDNSMGLSNKILSFFAKKIFTGFPYKNKNYIHIGNPVRKDFFTKKINNMTPLIQPPKIQICIFGGSQGAEYINNWVRVFFPKFKNIKIVLITGKNKKSPLEYNNILEIEFLEKGFSNLIKSSDIIITRAGGSISELSASQKCCILIPLPYSANNHQIKNAKYFEEKDSVIHIPQENLYKEETKNIILELCKNPKLRRKYEINLSNFRKENCTNNIVKYLL
jgi:UDP-N-acetylglucosamine--N-acetylmuramyl-(pentapeptide) pyrophosphoryl-undecaprenol N-acetylglucosamine transferase